MIIQVGGLSDGVHKYRFEAKASDLNLGSEFSDGITVKATLEKTGGQLFLKAEIQAGASFRCDRCVTPFSTTLMPSYRMNYLPDESEAGRFDPSEVQIISPGLNVVDMRDDVRQTILLSVPLKLLCREDCKGLCPRCGKNLNEGPCSCTEPAPDTGWEKLRELHDNMRDPR